MNNNGTFKVLKRADKFVISYIEKGEITYLDLYSFDRYPDAEEYRENHMKELDTYVSDMKEEQKRIEEERLEAERKAEEEKKVEEERLEAEKKAEKERKKQERKEKIKKVWANGWIKFISGFLIAVMLLTGGHFMAKGLSKASKDKGSNKPTTSQTDPTVPTKDVIDAIEDIKDKDEELNQSKFESLVAEYAKKYTDNKIDLTTEDVVKFVSIVNIDELLEENPEFAQELFGTQTWEVFMDDAMDVVGATYGYNYITYEKEKSTDNFIWVSDSVHGSQKDKVLIIEDYVKQIALAKGNSEEVNKLVTELLGRLASGDLTNLDSGVRFGTNVYLELIRSYFAKNELTKENFDELTTLVEMNLNNIMTEYEECVDYTTEKSSSNNLVRTKTRGNN